MIFRLKEANTLGCSCSQIVVVEFSKAIYTAAGNLQDSRANLWKDITCRPIRKFNRNDETSWNIVNLHCFFSTLPKNRLGTLYGILNEPDRSFMQNETPALVVYTGISQASTALNERFITQNRMETTNLRFYLLLNFSL